MTKILTDKVQTGLRLIGAEMSATADTMVEDRPEDAAAIRAALDWISWKEAQVLRARLLRASRVDTTPTFPQQPRKGNPCLFK